MDALYGLILSNVLVMVAFSATIIVNCLFLTNVLDAVCLNPEPFYQTYLLIISTIVSVWGLSLVLYINMCQRLIPRNQYTEKYIIFVFRSSYFCFLNLLCFLVMSRNTAALICPDDFKNYNTSMSAIFGFLPIVSLYFIMLSWMQMDYFEEFRNEVGTANCFF